MQGQETRDLGAMIDQQGDKLSFEMVHGHSRIDRLNEKLCWVYVRLPIHLPSSLFKNGSLCRF